MEFRSIYSSSGFKVKAICETCSIKSNMEAGERSKNMDVIARFLIYDHDVTESLGGKIKSALEGRILVIRFGSGYLSISKIEGKMFEVSATFWRSWPTP
jgi:hypothetical protein